MTHLKVDKLNNKDRKMDINVYKTMSKKESISMKRKHIKERSPSCRLGLIPSLVTDESFVDKTRVWRKYKVSILVSMMSLSGC